MKNQSLRCAVLVTALCLLVVGMASASSLPKLSTSSSLAAPIVSNVPFPTAGDAYCGSNICGTIPAGGQTDFMWTAGNYVISSIFHIPAASVTDLVANWQFQNFMGNGNSETWYAYVNGVAVAQVNAPDDGYSGNIWTASGTVTFAGIAPVAGGYQVELVLQNTVPFGGGSVAWLDGGTTGLSYTPEPGTMMLFGSGVIGIAGLLRRKLSL
jgi:hypothetical protein